MLPIIVNFCLAALKFFAGSICGLTSVMADGANNLMDALTSAFVEMGAAIAAIPGGKRHKNGHGRFEWLVAIGISCSIIMVGGELLKKSVKGIVKPSGGSFSLVALIILAVSIAAKIFLYFYNVSKAKEHNSQTYKAAALDCISDAVSTTVVLVSFIIQSQTGVYLDGYCGALVSIFILYNGFKSFADTAKRIIGEDISESAMDRLRAYVLNYEGGVISKCVDIQILDYGYERYSAVVNVIPQWGRTDEQILNDITGLRSGIYREFGFIATIQPMVPVDRNKENEIRKELEQFLEKLPYSISIADGTCVNRAGDSVQIFLCAEVPLEEGKKEKDIVSDIAKFAENRKLELVTKLSVISDKHRHRLKKAKTFEG